MSPGSAVHPVGPVLGGLVIHPLSHAVEVLRFYREFSATSDLPLLSFGESRDPYSIKRRISVMVPCGKGLVGWVIPATSG